MVSYYVQVVPALTWHVMHYVYIIIPLYVLIEG